MTAVETLILASYFFVLLILAVYGWHRYYLVYVYMRNRDKQPKSLAPLSPLPVVTIQLPLYNEMYVAERLIDAVDAVDAEGERAVAQVVLNRLRHPAFPKTICGVIFEGQERSTGCQFSFACDHALTRWSPTADQWRRARGVADAALSGAVYRPVGYATHYHTDWVVPYWQASLDKVVAVHSHLFFRWTGWWGTPPAFNRQVSSAEPVIAQLASVSDAHKTGAALAEADTALLDAAEALGMLGDDGAAATVAAIAPAAAGTNETIRPGAAGVPAT